MQLSKKVHLTLMLALSAIAFTSCSKEKMEELRDKHSPKTEAPDVVLTPADKTWYAGDISSIYYYEKDKPPVNAGGYIVMFKFTKDGHYEQLTHFDKMLYGIRTRTWTRIEGTVKFDHDDDEEDREFTLYPVTGYWSKRSNSDNYDNKEIPQSELKTNTTMSTTYRYSTFTDPNNSKRKFLSIRNKRQNDVETLLHWEE